MERGSIFLVPLMDETNCFGQVIGREPDALNSVAIALFDIRGNWDEEKDVPTLGRKLSFIGACHQGSVGLRALASPRRAGKRHAGRDAAL